MRRLYSLICRTRLCFYKAGRFFIR